MKFIYIMHDALLPDHKVRNSEVCNNVTGICIISHLLLDLKQKNQGLIMFCLKKVKYSCGVWKKELRQCDDEYDMNK